MKRLPDWPARLAALMDEALGLPFVWGRHDCVTYAARAVVCVTGVDHLRGLPAWSSASSALRALRKRGGLEAVVTERLGQPVPPLHARRGDIVLMRHGTVGAGWTEALGVCFGDRCGAPGLAGLVLRPLSDAALCWHAGEA